MIRDYLKIAAIIVSAFILLLRVQEVIRTEEAESQGMPLESETGEMFKMEAWECGVCGTEHIWEILNRIAGMEAVNYQGVVD